MTFRQQHVTIIKCKFYKVQNDVYRKESVNDSACKHKQRHNAFACVMFAATEGLACTADDKGQETGHIWKFVAILILLRFANQTLFLFEIAAC